MTWLELTKFVRHRVQVLNFWSPHRSRFTFSMASVKDDRPKMLWLPKKNGLTNMDKFRGMINRSWNLDLGESVIWSFLIPHTPMASHLSDNFSVVRVWLHEINYDISSTMVQSPADIKTIIYCFDSDVFVDKLSCSLIPAPQQVVKPALTRKVCQEFPTMVWFAVFLPKNLFIDTPLSHPRN